MAFRRGILERDYIFEYDLGRWTFGNVQVLRARDTGQLKTCRTVPKSLIRDCTNVLARLRGLLELRHPHIASVTDVHEDQANFYVLSDACEGGDVADWLQRLDETNWLQEQTCAAYVRQVVLAIVHAHAAQVDHRDLRPSSLLLTSKLPDASVKVGDFGLAAIFDPDFALVRREASAYTAPGVMQGNEPTRFGSPDVWSVGAIACTLLLGRVPNAYQGGKRGKSSPFVFDGGLEDEDDIWAERSHLSRDFVMRLLRPDGERPTAAKALQHPWLKGLMPIGGVHLRSTDSAAREARHKTLCYTLAVLLVPVLVPYRDFEQLRVAFNQSDSDHDGVIGRGTGQRLLLTRCALPEAVNAALSIADVGKEGVIDLGGAASADLIAREFFAAGPTGAPLAGPLTATDLAPRMLKRFFESFGSRQEAVTNANMIRAKLRTQTARSFESQAGVRYDEILACLPDDQPIDAQVLAQQLSINAGQGTPLSGCELSPLRSRRPWGSGSYGIGGFFASTCGIGSIVGGNGRRDESPHGLRLF